MTSRRPVVEPIDIGIAAKPPELRLPDLKHVFARRAARCDTLAKGSRLGAYLAFMADLAHAQDAALARLPAGTLPGAAAREEAGRSRLPLLDRSRWRRDPSWRHGLGTILEQMDRTNLTVAARHALQAVRGLDEHELEVLGDQALHFEKSHVDPAQLCFLAAALQVYWTRMAALLDAEEVGHVKRAGACPACGAPPVASLVYAAGALTNVRFLVCSLCASEWHVVRIKCANCDSTKGIAYQEIAGGTGAVKAETCDQCRTYTKILYLEKDREAEPFADDLASVALDVLVSEAGWQRASPNPFLIPGAG